MDEAENLSSTEDIQDSGEESEVSFSLLHPPKIGRYTILRRLGRGGFGQVFLAFDDDLDRPVAIKVPRPDRISQPEDVEAYLNEARLLASLDHPHIVPVFDVGRTDDGLCYVVSKLIEGSDLAARIKEARPGFQESAGLVAAIADALHYSHTRGLVHRDIKPGNILIDAAGKPYVADFGLALKEEDFGRGARLAGTPTYMSPEQARGEGHRVDGRSDIFGLGVVFYELLTGRRPFVAKTQDKDEARNELLDLITTTEARPPRQIDDTIPKELERICLKAMSKRATDRFTTARDMAEDLRHFLQTAGATVPPVVTPAVVIKPPGSTQEATPIPSTSKQSDSDQRPIKIVPKGLRSFDEHDADFFLALLPGPRDRDGLPDSIRFWKTRIEETDPDKTFRVGLIYGPSGCGKSSLIKAGLLPRLGKHVRSIYVEATAEETEARLLKGIRKACSELPGGLRLVESLANLRRGRILPPERKVLLVLDQFEQWLHAERRNHNKELVSALRHCDGEHLQAVVLVRDDFWLAASRFMRELEIRLVEGENSALVDLFDPRHARKVLIAFGRAYGALPERIDDLSGDQGSFLDQSIAELALDDKIVPVQLALFTEMIKGKPWTPATFRHVGGTQGIGLTFLEETFSASTAPPEHRFHQEAAQEVLKALLPGTGTDIKVQIRSRQELLELSGHANRPCDFDDLIRILDLELRLITPTDPKSFSSHGPTTTPPGDRHYQLAHDYLVPSLREWLTRKQRETHRGRAELRLAERSSLWNARPETRHLPSAMEWASIRLLTKKEDWNEPQRKMMRRAGQVHGVRGLTLIMVLMLLGWGWYEVNGRLNARILRDKLLGSPLTDVPGIVVELEPYRRWVDPLLRRAYAEAKEAGNDRKRLHAALALLPADDSQLPYLKGRLLSAEAQDISIIRQSLAGHKDILVAECWRVLQNPTLEEEGKALQAASTLALYDPRGPLWEKVPIDVTNRLVAENAYVIAHWIDALRPVAHQLRDPLIAVFYDERRGESERNLAASALAEYVSDQPHKLTELIVDATERQFAALYPSVERRSDQTAPLLEAELTKTPPPQKGLDPTDLDNKVWHKFYKGQANAAVSLIRMGRPQKSLALLKHGPDPSLRSYLVHCLGPLGVEPNFLIAKLDQESDVSIRRALILSLGEYGRGRIWTTERDTLTKRLLGLYRTDPDPGIHGAAEWLLRQWGNEKEIKGIDKELTKLPLPRVGVDQGPTSSQGNNRRWYINSQGQALVIVRGPVEFDMGEAANRHRKRIDHSFAIATKEVSVDQFQKVLKENPHIRAKNYEPYSPEPTCPMNSVSWYDATAYCNWLSKQEGLPEDQWYYGPNEKGNYAEGMRLMSDPDKRTGYRLPTEAEWEYSCRAETATRYSFGEPWELLEKYGWYSKNSPNKTHPVGILKPNDLGLFDVHGNLYEWCHDQFNEPGENRDDIVALWYINDNTKRILRGGAFNSQPALVSSAHGGPLKQSSRYYLGGFRPSRTLP